MHHVHTLKLLMLLSCVQAVIPSLADRFVSSISRSKED